MKIETVFLDMDGVLTDFVGGVCRALGKTNPYPKETRDYTFWNAWPDISTKDVNAYCTFDFWQNLEWVYDGRDILKAIMDTLGLGGIYLLTKPMPNPESPTGKWLWIYDNLPVYLERTIITQAPKSLLARPGTLLIDDNDENIDEFIAAGGEGTLVPRPWNRLWKQADRSSQYVRECLETLC